MTRQRAVSVVVTTALTLIAASMFADTSRAAAASVALLRASNVTFDVHTPLPIGPCNGEIFAHGAPITYSWNPIENRYYL